jgi:hypothetical protein
MQIFLKKWEASARRGYGGMEMLLKKGRASGGRRGFYEKKRKGWGEAQVGCLLNGVGASERSWYGWASEVL